VAKHGLTVAFDVLVEPDARAGLGQDHLQRDLAALKRITRQVVAVKLDQIEGKKENALVSPMVTDEIGGKASDFEIAVVRANSPRQSSET
jgi:hypothetical protein